MGASNETSFSASNGRLIIMGLGARLEYHTALADYEKLVAAIEREIYSENDVDVIFPQWLGYPDPNVPYELDDTVLFPTYRIALGIDKLLRQFPNRTVDLICFSFSGVVALYWAKEKARSTNPADQEQLKRIQSITTINSPLKGSDRYFRLAKWDMPHLLKDGFVPPAIRDLQPGSEVNRMIWSNPDQCPVPTLLNVITEGDKMVKPDDATVPYASETFPLDKIEADLADDNDATPADDNDATPPDNDDKKSVHRLALEDERLINKILSTLKIRSL